MKSQNTKSSDELKREVDQQINKVNRDIDNIQGRLTPGQIIDDAIFYPHGRNLTNTMDHLKRNPVGTTFLTLGTILLMEDENHLTMEHHARNRVTMMKEGISSVKQTLKEQMPHKELTPGTVPSAGDVAKEKVSHLKETIQAKVSDIKEHIPSKEELRSKLQRTKERTKEGISTKFDEIQERFSEEEFESRTSMKEKASELYASGKDKIKNMDPVSYMALGAGLGALTGMALPISEKEDSLVHSKFDSKLSNLSSELKDAINESSNILKELVVNDLKDYSFRPFK